jgi:methylmalonyl-CoA/ethylmalonyl-CoA epimerase
MVRRDFTINHVGYAVQNIERFLADNEVLYGRFERGPVIVNERQRVREMFISDGKTVLELLEPLGQDSPIARFLKSNREGGLVHVALDVDDISEAITRIKAAGGVVMVQPTPDVAFGERRIAFVAIEGQLTELIERPRVTEG